MQSCACAAVRTFACGTSQALEAVNFHLWKIALWKNEQRRGGGEDSRRPPPGPAQAQLYHRDLSADAVVLARAARKKAFLYASGIIPYFAQGQRNR